MYERFFGFEEAPFRLTPDPRYLFLSAKHKEALGHLVYGLKEGAGFVAITGEIGAGKTTLLRSFLSEPPENACYAYILNPVLTGVELLQEINHELGIREQGTQRELLVALNQFLLDQKARGNQVVLVIDEAQALGGAILEQLRMLSNFETETAKLLQIVLVGQPELRDLLARPDLEQLEQRITVRWHLGPLDRQETAQYVGHRLATASGGRARRIFTAGGLRRVHAWSEGVPRKINVVCHRALLVAYARDSTSVTRSIVRRAIEEIESPRRREPVRAGRLPDWAPLAAGVAAVAVVGGLAAWQWFPRRSTERAGVETGVAKTVSAPADLPRALDAVDRAPVALQPSRPGGPRVAAQPLTLPLQGWPPGGAAESGWPSASGAAEPGSPTASDGAEPGLPSASEAAPPAAPPERGAAAPALPDAAVVVGMPADQSVASVSVERALVPEAAAGVEAPSGAVAASSDLDDAWIQRAAIADALRQSTPTDSAYEAVAALLRVWDGEPLSPAEAASQALDLPSIARRRGLDYLPFRGNMNVLRVLDLPAILELDAGDGSGAHFAMVDRVDDEGARVTIGRGTFAVSHDILSELWFGQGHVLWYDVDGIGRVLARGAAGREVARLHELLRIAGVYHGAGGDRFGEETEEAVVRFQRATHLEADGKVGPMTMIALYGRAAPDRVPQLAVDEATATPLSVARGEAS